MKNFTNSKMQKQTIILFMMVFLTFFDGWGQQSNFLNVNEVDKSMQADYKQFLENQKTPLLKSDYELYTIGDRTWLRCLGENEYYLSPSFVNEQDKTEYYNRITRLNDPENGFTKSTFYYIKVEINPLCKTLLYDMNVYVPDYVKNNVIVFLPEIDIDFLRENNISLTLLESYGKNNARKVIEDKNGTRATLWSENFESGFPNSHWIVSNSGSNDCGWDDISIGQGSCNSGEVYSGSHSLWCADLGIDCEATKCSQYVNNMTTEVIEANYTNISCYTNVIFYFKMMVDFYNTGSNDKLYIYYDINDGNGFQLLIEYDSNSSEDGAGWQSKSVININSDYIAFAFAFYSNSVGNGTYGAYLDDMSLTGDFDCSACGPTANASTTSNTTCGLNNGSAQVSVSGGTSPYSYHWNNGSSSSSISNLSSGTYCVTVTDANGCTNSDCTTINGSTGVTANASTVQHNTLCGGCNGEVNASGGTSYSWSSGLGSGAHHYNVCAGNYTVTVTDANGCTATANTTVNNNSGGPTSLNISYGTDNGSCDGSLTVTTYGGTPPYTYNWSNGCTSSSCNNLCAGTYYVTVTDANNCSLTGSGDVNSSAIEDISFINSLTIFPNPTSKAFTITMDITKAKDMELNLMDVTGKVLVSDKIKVTPGTFTKVVDMSRYAKGIYSLQLVTDEGIINRKIVLQ